MRTIKMLGFAVMAVLIATALVGASSAMAESTALCKVDTALFDANNQYIGDHECPLASRISHVHESTLPGNENRASLLTNLATIRCQVLFLGDVLSAGLLSTAPTPLLISGKFTYSECNLGCTVVEVNGPVHIDVLKEGHELAKITGKGEVKIDCSLIAIHCTYNGEGLVGHGLGPLLSVHLNGDTVLSEQETKKVSGTACPEKAKLDITTTPLEHVYISR